ncbi:MAG: serine/threonine-protein kinase [Polyangiaceae bacterium]|nr:serine/threonine-protein kinase [Polyangiaceae bacterium]
MSISPSDPSLAFPERLGRYELLLPIGSGGMATVYLGRYRGAGGFERDVAVKVMHAHLREDEESKLHLLDEARLAARIRHPNVVPVLEVGDEAFGLYLVLEYVEGDSLAGLLRVWPDMDAKKQNRLLARIMSDALCGLEEAHGLKGEDGAFLGLVHRDFSPHNIMVGVDGVARLTDFSVAKASDRAVRTRTGMVKGKIGYMSPEQARGHALDRRCDVWAAGVVLWELAASRRLFPKSDAVSTLLKIVTEAPPRLSTVLPEVSPELDDIVASALSMDVETRCPSAVELRKNLERFWLKHDGIADREEVAAFVSELVGERLRTQRQRIAEVQELRKRMVEIARDAGPQSATPRELELAPQREGELPVYQHAAAPGNIEWNPTPLSKASANFARAPREVTESTISAASVSPPKKRTPMLVALSAVGVILILGLLALIRRPEQPAGPSAGSAPEPNMVRVEVQPPASSLTPTAPPPEAPPPVAPPAVVTPQPQKVRPAADAPAPQKVVKKPRAVEPGLSLAKDPY